MLVEFRLQPVTPYQYICNIRAIQYRVYFIVVPDQTKLHSKPQSLIKYLQNAHNLVPANQDCKNLAYW